MLQRTHSALEKARGAAPLLLIVAGALALRVWGLDFGLPYADARPDETIVIRQAFGYGTGDLNPHSFLYPSLYSYVTFAFYGAYACALLVLGRLESLQDIVQRYVVDPTPFFLIPRALSAALGTLTVPAVFVLGRRMAGRWAGVLAALFLAPAFLHVRDSHFGVTDVAMTAAVTVTVVLALKLFREGRMRHYVAAGIGVGIAASLKYNGALVFIAPLAAHLLADGKTSVRRRLLSPPLAVMAGCALAAFVLTSPFVVLDWRTFVKDFSWQIEHLSGATNVALSRGWIHHAVFNLRFGVGMPLLVLAAVGLVRSLRYRPRLTAVAAGFSILYYVVIGQGLAVFARYAVPLVPFCCVFAAEPLAALCSRQYRRPWARVLAGVTCVAAVCLVSIPQVMKSLRLDVLLAREDTRELCARDLERRLPSGTAVGWLGTTYGLPRLHEDPQSLQEQLALIRARGGSGRLQEARIAVARERGTGLRVQPLDVHWLPERLPHFVLTEYYPIAWPEAVFAEAEPLLRARGYRRVARFEGAERSRLEADGVRYDVQDSFYLPYEGLTAVSRPGPSLALWAGPQDSEGRHE